MWGGGGGTDGALPTGKGKGVGGFKSDPLINLLS